MFFLNKKKNKQDNQIDQVLKNPKILEVNLIKDEIHLSFDWKKNIKVVMFAVLITGAIIAEAYYGLDWWAKSEAAKLEQLQAETKKMSQDVNDFRQTATDALSYKDKTMDVGSILNNHVYWTNLFSWLEKNTLSTVSFGGFSGTLDGRYTLTGTAGSFADVSWQVKNFLEDPMTLKASVGSVTSGQGKTKAELAAEESQRQEEEKQAAEAAETAGTEEAPVAAAKEVAPVPGVGFSLTLEVNPEIFNK